MIINYLTIETMEVEGKKIDQISKKLIKEASITRDELNTYVFTLGVKHMYRHLTGNEIRYRCTTKCTEENCECRLPSNPTK